MNERDLQKLLAPLGIGQVRLYETVSSTNDIALAWAAEGASGLALVFAEEQTAGRGRGERSWYSPRGASLAFSLILSLIVEDPADVTLVTGLGALAVHEALVELNLTPAIKWPNDVLLGGKKVSGVLMEAIWTGAALDRLVLGIGVNVRPESVPATGLLNFPATCLDIETGTLVDRYALLKSILSQLVLWSPRVGSPQFLHAWEQRLAYRGEWVQVEREGTPALEGLAVGLDRDGALRLQTSAGVVHPVRLGEVKLRPLV